MLEMNAPEIELSKKAGQILSTKDQQQYERDGFLILPHFISHDICQLLIDRAHSIVRKFASDDCRVIFSTRDQQHAKNNYFLESGDKIRCFFEEGAFCSDGELKSDIFHCINKIGHALHDLDPVFNCFSRMHQIATLVNDLGIVDPLLAQSMYVFKQPYIGGEVNCHQDATFLYTEKHPITGLWFALEDATLENGCLWAIPGGHKSKLKSRFLRNNQNDTTMEVYDEAVWPLETMVPLEVPRGSVIVLHGLLPHMSKENISPHSRHAYTLHIMSGEDAYPSNNWLQRSAQFPFRGFL